MNKHYIVSLIPRKGISFVDVEESLNKRKDWYRIKPNVWIVVTKKKVVDLYRTLSEFAKPDGQIFICGLRLEDRAGWLNADLIEWLRSRDENTQ